jgi:hypothetical protein
LLEHLFAGEVMRHTWLSGSRRMEVLKPQVDDGGYDLVLEARNIVRHVQLKATFKGSRSRGWAVNVALSTKPSGCVVGLLFDEVTLQLGPFLWFGGTPGKPLPDLSQFKVAKHTKGNAHGLKAPRPGLRVVPRSAFVPIATIGELSECLFGPPPG